MDISRRIPFLKAGPLKLQDKLADDWVQPFACNHVVVNFTPNATTKDNSKHNSKKKADQTSYCVMCGELLSQSKSEKEQAATVDDIKHNKRKTKGLEAQPMYDEVHERRQMFASSRKMSSSLSFVAPLSTNSCTIHVNKKLKYFCEDHQEVCCSVCVNVLHRGCQRIMFIKDEIRLGWSNSICEDTLTALDAISKSFREILDYSESTRQKLNTEVLEFRKRRDELRSRLVHIMDEFEKSSEKMIKKFIKLSEQQINSASETCRDVIREAEANRELLEKSLKASSTDEAFIATQKVLLQREKYGVALSEVIKNSKDISIDLIPESDISNIEDIMTIGSVQFIAETVDFPETVISAVAKIPKSELRSPRSTKDARSESCSSLKGPAYFVGKYNVRLPEDKCTCENVGILFLTDGRVAIVDMKNCKLKVFDTKFSQACTVQLSSEPRGVATISPQEVAVSLPDESKIQFISTGKKLQTTRSILTSLPCYGITCHNQAIVLLCDDGFSTKAIQVIDLDGHVLKTLNINKPGKVLLQNPWNITMSVDGQQICVTDKGRLVNIDIKGSVLFEYTDTNLDNARGLTVDDSGRFYVCGTSSNNVHQVSADGKQINVILTNEDVTAPQAVCYQFGKRNLLLSCVGNDYVFMYKLAKVEHC